MGASKPVVLRSAANPTVRHLIRMRDNRARRKAGSVIVDGWRETLQAVNGGLKLMGLYVPASDDPRQSADPAIADFSHLVESSGDLHWVSDSVMNKIAFGQSPRGVVAELRAPQTDLSQLKLAANPLLLVLDQIEKPGNVGAIFRCADAAGVDAVLLCDSGDPWNPNSIRSSQGCVFHIPGATGTQHELSQFLAEHSIRLVAARVESSQLLWEAELRGPLAILLGSEAEGLGSRWTEVSGQSVEGVRIPMAGSIDSLNVSVSAAVILFEAIRQRAVG